MRGKDLFRILFQFAVAHIRDIVVKRALFDLHLLRDRSLDGLFHTLSRLLLHHVSDDLLHFFFGGHAHYADIYNRFFSVVQSAQIIRNSRDLLCVGNLFVGGEREVFENVGVLVFELIANYLRIVRVFDHIVRQL